MTDQQLRETIRTALHNEWWRSIREKIEDAPDGHVDRLTDAIMRHMGAPVETPDVTVKVSRELLGELADWSEPVQVMVTQVGGEYDMIFRRPSILVELTGDRAPMPWMRRLQIGTEEIISDVPHRRMRIRLTAEMGA